MEAHHQQRQEKSVETKQHSLNDQQHKNQIQDDKNSSPKQPQVTLISPASPPSSSSSPSHEFSFTISLHTTTTTTSTSSSSSSSSKYHRNFFDHNKLSKLNHTNNTINNTSQNTPLAIDLSPADDIFFHGHLLPLHLLSHLPVSPRSSTNSLDSFTLPIKDLSPSEPPQNPSKTTQIPSTTTKNMSNNKPKSFSLFNLGRWKKPTCEQAQDTTTAEKESQEEEKRSSKIRFDMSQVIKRYMRMVRPLLFFQRRRNRRRNSIHFQRQPYSFSGVLSPRNSSDIIDRKRAGQYSAPASMRTSPSNSGLLVATATATLPSAASDSTMEELQAAIQAAIAHCKNSIAADRDNKLHHNF